MEWSAVFIASKIERSCVQPSFRRGCGPGKFTLQLFSLFCEFQQAVNLSSVTRSRKREVAKCNSEAGLDNSSYV